MNFLQRLPFAIAGAFGLLSLGSDVIEFEKHIATWIHVWQSVTYPVMEFLFGWLFEWIGWTFPDWSKDYLMIGFVTLAARFRVVLSLKNVTALKEVTGKQYRYYWQSTSLFNEIKKISESFALWPLYILRQIRNFTHGHQPIANTALDTEEERIIYLFEFLTKAPARVLPLIFFEVFIYALLIIAASYALIFSGFSSPAAL